MNFEYRAPHWYAEVPFGWDQLPAGTRPSDVVRDDPKVFFRSPRPRQSAAVLRRCDTTEEYDFALVQRLAARLGARIQRPATQIKGRRRFKGAHAVRGVLCLCAKRLGVRRSTLARFLGRRPGTLSNYAMDAREAMERDPAFRQLYNAVVDDEHEADACGLPGDQVPICRGPGEIEVIP